MSNNHFPFPDQLGAAVSDAAQSVASTADQVGKSVAPVAQSWIERTTETVGRFVTPIADNPLVKMATKAPGIKWLMAALGQVDVATVHEEVLKLRQTYPADSNEQLAQRVIANAATKAAGIGLAANVAPPLALSLLGLELAAINALQAEMVYHIAAIYGFEPNDPTRRGEVLALWGLSMGGSNVLKAGLSVVELVPLVGPAVGIASNAGLLYALGYVACQFYENKRASFELDAQRQLNSTLDAEL
ncbi:hypothetical protein ACQ4M4_01665 [Leptolyngbya sp. AN02str]|uniref:hypothetical protein n=1 Tax=Leptolyngbya sp. AN02str TaxID=3423363 RepID=UPI003D31F531